MSTSVRGVVKVGLHVISAVVWIWSLIRAIVTGKGWGGVLMGLFGHVVAASL
jgi:hypothetical protein